MSLKAKLEAVIYAAEEPVTLAQLAVLFADEALEWQAEQQAELRPTAARPLLLVVPSAAGRADELDLDVNLDADEEGRTAAPPAAAPEETPTEAAMSDAEAEPQAEAQVAADQAEPADEAPAEATAAEVPTEAVVAEAAAHAVETPAEAVPPSEESGSEAVEPETPEAAEKRLSKQRDRQVRAILRGLLDELVADYSSDERGMEIREIAGGYRMATKPDCHEAVRSFVKSLKPALKLSLPALETLAVVAYKQPVTAPEIAEIRGVESAGVLGSLLARKLIATAGRKPVIGRPILYKTTREFLLRFGLKDVGELPSMEEFEKMAASELDEPELVGESRKPEEPEPEPDQEGEPAESESGAPGPEPVLEFASPAEGEKPEPDPASEADATSPEAPEPPSAAQAEQKEQDGNQA